VRQLGKSLYHSCESIISRQGITLPLDGHSYRRRLLTFILFYKWHWADIRLYTMISLFAKSCVFSKQSFPTFLCQAIASSFSLSYRGILPSSLQIIISYAFSILYLSTWVGLRYGYYYFQDLVWSDSYRITNVFPTETQPWFKESLHDIVTQSVTQWKN